MKYEVIVIGGGMAGLSCALGLAKFGFHTAIIDTKVITKNFNVLHPIKRVSAINSASENFLKKLSVWEKIASIRTNDYVEMQIWDQNSSAELKLNAQECSLKSLGKIIENDLITAQMYNELKKFNVPIFEESYILEIKQENHNNILKLKHGVILESLLIVGADGANSFIRQYMQFKCTKVPYNHYAITLNVNALKPHKNIAYQRFLYNGVLAILPLSSPHLCSIVYSFFSQDVSKIENMSDKVLGDYLTIASENILGTLDVVDNPRVYFELMERHVYTYFKENVVLIGDAAHTIHPLAGQGINLGFADANSLIEILSKAKKLGRNINDPDILAKYVYKRKFANQLMINVVGELKKLFCNNHIMFKPLRALGMNMVNKNKLIKKFLIKKGLGL